MRVRHIISSKKTISADTSWKTTAIPTKHSGIFPKSMPVGPAWQWRSALAFDGEKEYILLCRVNLSKDNWLAWLIGKNSSGWSLVGRYEYHGNHPGLHVHADCERGGIEVGPTSIKTYLRIPRVSSRGTRPSPSRLDLFWKNACQHYRMDYEKGDLL